MVDGKPAAVLAMTPFWASGGIGMGAEAVELGGCGSGVVATQLSVETTGPCALLSDGLEVGGCGASGFSCC